MPVEEQSARSSSALIFQAGEGQVIDAFGNRSLFKLTGDNTGGARTITMAEVPPGHGPPHHVHHSDDEVFLIIEGQYRFLVDGVWKDVGPNGLVFLPRDCPHTFVNAGSTTSRHWAILWPSGFETFYARCAEVFAAKGPPDRERLGQISREHGYEFLPPPAPAR